MTEKVSCWELKEEVVLIMVTKIQILKIIQEETENNENFFNSSEHSRP